MNELTRKEIDQISDDIDRQGLTYTRLKNEILDHICCQVEAWMETGLSFHEAYAIVGEEMGKHRIRQIQDETLILISKKYRRMKRMMYVFGVAAPVLVLSAATFKIMHWQGSGLLISLALLLTGAIFLPLLVMVRIRDTRRQDEAVPTGLYITGLISGTLTIIGAMFKIQHWAGASILLTLGMVLLGFVFMPVLASVKIRKARKDGQPVNKLFLIGGVIAGILVITGTLFKIMHWQGAGIIIMVSWSIVAVILLPLLVLTRLKQKENKIDNFTATLLISIAIAIVVMLWMRSVPRAVIAGFTITESNMNENARYFNDRVETLRHSMELSESVHDINQVNSFFSESEKLSDYINSLLSEVVPQLSGQKVATPNSSVHSDLYNARFMENRDVAYKTIVVIHGNELYHLLMNFRDSAMQLTNDPDLRAYIEFQFKLATPLGDSKESWAKYYFTGPFLQSAAVLRMYLSTVRIIECELLRELAEEKDRKI